ncbi:MAG: hypothetical protein Greene041619_626 [Candidatus Peregrinibacteria bacterium Greene0416_19]|nr:MAG: hypothetical protein Greene041619_626 [Candidatus Peregrinibacteria bacterium Greene0416_19]
MHLWSTDNPRVPDGWLPIRYTSFDLLPSALFDIHHGIELFLKSTLSDLGQSDRSSHDILHLFTKIQRVILETEWIPIQINEDQDILTQEEIDRLQQQVIPELQELIAYFAQRKILQEEIDDPQNELFRYPQTRKGKSYNMAALASIDVKDLLWRIDRLYEHLQDIGYLVAVDRRHQPRKGVTMIKV